MFALFFIVLWLVVFILFGQLAMNEYTVKDGSWFWYAGVMATLITALVFLGIWNFANG